MAQKSKLKVVEVATRDWMGTRLEKIIEQLSEEAGRFEDMGLETEQEWLDDAATLVDKVLDSLESRRSKAA